MLTVYAPSQTDYFNSPVKENGAFPEPVANASLFYTELTGDFVFKTKVELEFKNFYDAAALLVYENENVWAKLALENSDLPCRKPAVVSVVTNRISDDCNGPVMDGNSVWFQVSRVDDCFAFHYSVDGTQTGFSSKAPGGGYFHYDLECLAEGSAKIENMMNLSSKRILAPLLVLSLMVTYLCFAYGEAVDLRFL